MFACVELVKESGSDEMAGFLPELALLDGISTCMANRPFSYNVIVVKVGTKWKISGRHAFLFFHVKAQNKHVFMAIVSPLHLDRGDRRSAYVCDLCMCDKDLCLKTV